MNAGLPGTGIGGVFYLVSVFFMPFLELFKTMRGESSLERWQLVGKQLVMAGSIIGGMWLMGLILGMVVAWSGAAVGKPGAAFHLGYTTHLAQLNMFHIVPLVISLITLSTIYLLTHMMRFVYAPVVEG